MCPCYNRRTHYPTLEKYGAQNITACENQDKQRELSDNWKLKKRLLEKITGDNAKKKRLTEIQVLTQMFTKRVFYESNRFDKAYSNIWNILFDQIFKNLMCSNSSNYLDEKHQIKL